LGITGVDPLKFDLLFEPFLNPDQITLPYFSFDFDEDGREKILPWLIEKYGKEKIAQLATFEPNKKLHINFCAVVIGADDLDKFIPIASIKPSWYSGEAMIFTSCDKSTIKEMGLVKLDLLGLTALSTIKGTLSDIQKTKGIEIDISKIPLDDAKTFELFKKGNTEDIFQFHSVGMQTDLLALQPDKFENLIALLVSSKGAANKSHAAAYTLIGYQMAYLKANFREEFEENVSLYKL
jgi:DNA polymerase III alpha subunit